MVADYRVSATRRWNVDAKGWGIVGAVWTTFVAFVSWYFTGLSLKKAIKELKDKASVHRKEIRELKEELVKKNRESTTAVHHPSTGLRVT